MKMKFMLALSASLATIGCASSGLVGQGPARSIAPGVAQQAAQQHPQVVAQFGGAVTGPLADYVTGVGRRVAAQSGIRGAGAGAYTFTVLNSPVPNAFAVPGGYIYITRGLLALANSEAELASILGHEIGHVVADHSKQRQDRGLLTQLGSVLAGAVTGSGQIAQVAGQLGQGLFLSYSRSQEFEADSLGVRYTAGAGYDANAAASLLASLGRWSELEDRLQGRDQRAIPSWARTHPLSEDRVRRASAQATQIQPAGAGVLNREELLRRIDGMVFGDDLPQGIIEGRQFIHPELRFRFTAPQGYSLQNSTRAVSISGQGGQAQFSTGQFSGSLDSYIGQVYQGITGGQGQLSIPQPRATTVNGIPAAYTSTRVATQQGQVDVSVMAYRWDADTAYHFVTLTPAGSGFGPFQQLVGSLERLSASEAAAIRPRIVDVVTVQRGDTIQSLARRLAFSDYQMERFLALNSLTANSTLTPGSQVKIVVYGNR